ncbi:MAG: endonuclease Q family protein [Candidatus Omnitrophota bacterium]
MRVVADFHIHSKYSRATSKDMDIENLSKHARLKGIQLLGTGDFTYPLWLIELKEKLTPRDYGLFEYGGTYFILTTEVCNIFLKDGKSRRVHNIIFAPTFEVVDTINSRLQRYGNLMADGRPMLGLSCRDLAELVFSVSQECLIVPGHIWTPWFSIFGSMSGFNSVEECFEGYAKDIYCLETGLSSDPAMNWRLSALDRYSLISNSDSHSPGKIGREANVFDVKLAYAEIIDALKKKDNKRFSFTVEFFPEEGKYHYDGHRVCNVRFSPEETKKRRGLCPVCNRPVTVGVMNRVDALADRKAGFLPEHIIPFKSMIPLEEIIAQVRMKSRDSQAVQTEYKSILQRFGSEFKLLLDTPEKELLGSLPSQIARAIINVRNGKVTIEPGYDGVYGTIGLPKDEDKKEKQLTLF